MSTLKVNNLQVGQDGTAANNYTLYQPASPDGTVRLGYGVSGSVTDILTLKNSSLGIGTDNPTNAALHVEGRNFAFGGPGGNASGQGNLYIGNFDNPLLDSYNRNIRIGSGSEIQIELYTDWDGTQYGDSIIYSSPEGMGWQFNGAKGGVSRSGIYPISYSAGNALTDDRLFFQAGNKYLWFDGDTGRLGVNRSTENGWTDTLDVNGTARVTGVAKFDSNVGIGTDSPSAKLHISNGNANDHSDGILLSKQGGNIYGIYPSTNNLEFKSVTGNTHIATFSYGGNVGIGTNNPTSKLIVYGEGGGNDTYSTAAVVIGKTTGPKLQATQESADNDVQGLAVFVHPSATNSDAPEERFRFHSTGKFLVSTGTYGMSGTISKSAVNSHQEAGDFRISGKNGPALTAGSYGSSNVSGAYTGLGLAMEYPKIGLFAISEGTSYGQGDFAICINDTADSSIATLSHEKFRIKKNGNVGIGTDNPAEKLHVTGTILGTNFKGSSNSSGFLTLAASSGNTTIDTGISINASNGGATMMVLANRNTSNGTATAGGIYLLTFRYDGNHVPRVTHLGGDNFCTFGKTAGNNLSVNCSSGNWTVSAFFGGYGIGGQL